MTYTLDLVYDDPECTPSMNNQEMEPSLKRLPKTEQKEILELRDREAQGILPPVILKYNTEQGFYATAAVDLPMHTLLCEYIGEVRKLKQVEMSKNDSIFDILEVKMPNSSERDLEKSLCVLTLRHANVGRFFNSVNPTGRKGLMRS